MEKAIKFLNEVPVFDGILLITLAILVLAFVVWLLLFQLPLLFKRCDHRFTKKEVLDWNVDPCCTRCKVYLSKIQSQRRIRLELAGEDEYKAVRA